MPAIGARLMIFVSRSLSVSSLLRAARLVSDLRDGTEAGSADDARQGEFEGESEGGGDDAISGAKKADRETGQVGD